MLTQPLPHQPSSQPAHQRHNELNHGKTYNNRGADVTYASTEAQCRCGSNYRCGIGLFLKALAREHCRNKRSTDQNT